MIIQTQQELEALCADLAQKPYITIDTEFLRDKTFYARLCLIQVAADGIDAHAIDPIATDLDWTSLNDLLHNEKVLKVFHAARQDLEIFYQMNGKIPSPIFDTQVAAMVCGYGDSIAYNRLVENITRTALAKNAQFTDWSRRPLADKQISYALDDVTYLRDVYKSLDNQLKKQKRDHWVKEEMAILTNPDTYEMPVETIWKRIKIRSNKPEVLAVLRELAMWRELRAREKDIPRGRVIKDDALADIATYMPKNVEGLRRIRSLNGDIAKGKLGKVIIERVQKARKSPKDTWPTPPSKIPLTKSAIPTLEMLKTLLKINCGQENVATKLIANNDILEQLCLPKVPTDLSVLKGWRYEIFGKDALDMKEGKLMIGLENGKIKKFYP